MGRGGREEVSFVADSGRVIDGSERVEVGGCCVAGVDDAEGGGTTTAVGRGNDDGEVSFMLCK